MGLGSDGDWPDEINDPMVCCEMLYGLAEQLEQYKLNIEAQGESPKGPKPFNVESSEYQHFVSEIEDLRDEKDAIRLERDGLLSEVKRLARRESVLKDSIQHEDARLKSLKSSTHLFADKNDWKSPINGIKSEYNLVTTPNKNPNLPTPTQFPSQHNRGNSVPQPRNPPPDPPSTTPF